MFLDYGYRSACCYAPIRLGKKKIKNTKLTLKVWVCCNCKKKDVKLVDYNKNEPGKATFPDLDTDDEPMVE